jgi:type II secretory pathway pseudopilin PulG
MSSPAPPTIRRRRRGERGHSLVEFTLALALILTIAVAVFSLFSSGQAAVRDAEAGTTAVLLAQELLEEVASRAFEEPGTTGTFGRESGESALDRRTWDDVDDANGYGPTSPPRDITGAILQDFTGFSRSVTVENVADTNFGSVQPSGSTAFKRIVVRVTSTVPGASDVVLETVVGRP